MKAYHILNADFTSQHGTEAPWKLGEERTIPLEYVSLCSTGYHYASTIAGALNLGHIQGTPQVLTQVEVNYMSGCYKDNFAHFFKGVTNKRKLLSYVELEPYFREVTRKLLIWACAYNEDVEVLLRNFDILYAGTRMSAQDTLSVSTDALSAAMCIVTYHYRYSKLLAVVDYLDSLATHQEYPEWQRKYTRNLARIYTTTFKHMAVFA